MKTNSSGGDADSANEKKSVLLFMASLLFLQFLATVYVEGLHGGLSTLFFLANNMMAFLLRRYFIGDSLLFLDRNIEGTEGRSQEIHLFGTLTKAKEVINLGEKRLLQLTSTRYYAMATVLLFVWMSLIIKFLPQIVPGLSFRSTWLIYFLYTWLLLLGFQTAHFLVLAFLSLITFYFGFVNQSPFEPLLGLPFLFGIFLCLSLYRNMNGSRFGVRNTEPALGGLWKATLPPFILYVGLIGVIFTAITWINDFRKAKPRTTQVSTAAKVTQKISHSMATAMDDVFYPSANSKGKQKSLEAHPQQGAIQSPSHGGSQNQGQGADDSFASGGGNGGGGLGTQGLHGGGGDLGALNGLKIPNDSGGSSQALNGSSSQQRGVGSGGGADIADGAGGSPQALKKRLSQFRDELDHQAAANSQVQSSQTHDHRSQEAGNPRAFGNQKGPRGSSSNLGPEARSPGQKLSGEADDLRDLPATDSPHHQDLPGKVRASSSPMTTRRRDPAGDGTLASQNRSSSISAKSSLSENSKAQRGAPEPLDVPSFTDKESPTKEDAFFEKKQRIAKKSRSIANFLESFGRLGKLIFLLAFGYIILLLMKGFKKEAKPQDLQESFDLSPEMKKMIRRKEEMLLRLKLSPEEEVVKSYQLFLSTLSMANFPKDSWMPVKIFETQSITKFKTIQAPAEVLSEVFCDHYYGENAVTKEQLLAVRAARKDFVGSMVF